MGNYSVYVYNTINDYMALYPKGQDELSEMHVEGLLLAKNKLAVITDYKKRVAQYKPDVSKTLIYYNGGLDNFEDKYPQFKHVTDVFYRHDDSKIVFENELNESIVLPVPKYIGNVLKTGWLNKDHRAVGFIMFDEQYNRLNVILTSV